MPFELSKYQEIMDEMNNPETTVARRTELSMQLINDYTGVHQEINQYKTTIDNQKKNIEDVTHAHAKILREYGMSVSGQQQQQQQATHSETITLEQIERSVGLL